MLGEWFWNVAPFVFVFDTTVNSETLRTTHGRF